MPADPNAATRTPHEDCVRITTNAPPAIPRPVFRAGVVCERDDSSSGARLDAGLGGRVNGSVVLLPRWRTWSTSSRSETDSGWEHMNIEQNGQRQQAWRDSARFLGTFLKHPASIGAGLPSSRRLAHLLVGGLDLAPGDLIVEFGPGTGPMTRRLQQGMPGGARYLGIEIDRGFCAELPNRFPDFDFVHGSAANVAAILAERGLSRPRLIVSGIPFASLRAGAQHKIVSGIADVLHEDGEFRTFQYVHSYGLPASRRFRAMMEERFGEFERLGPVLRNVPPAYVLAYRR